jgi:serine protease Do
MIKRFWRLNLLTCVLAILLVSSKDVARLNTVGWASNSPPLSTKVLSSIARQITVRVWADDLIGSGVIIQKQGKTYTVITNQHVLRAGKSPYQIETSDGKRYSVRVVPQTNPTGYDLALLQFDSPQIEYTVAQLRQSTSLAVGEETIAVGFPYPEVIAPKEKQEPVELAIKSGRVSIVLNKALTDGYQIGSTNDVEKGMSGGPLLDLEGNVVGINGKHAYPLWDAPELYQDGSEPCQPLQDLIVSSSFAIPIEVVAKLSPQSFSFSRFDRGKIVSQPLDTVKKMQERATAAESCQSSSANTQPH